MPMQSSVLNILFPMQINTLGCELNAKVPCDI